MPRPKISIVTIVLNAAADFRRTRFSIESQKRDWLEWIVIDGGSTDETIREIEEARHLIDGVVSEKDTGIYNAMNKGARAANGDLLWYMNAGDEVFPGALGRLDGIVDVLSDEKIYCAPRLIIFQDGTEKLDPPQPEALTHRMSISHQATIHPRELPPVASAYDERYRLAGDFDFFLRAKIGGAQFETLDFPLAIFHRGGRTDQYPITGEIEKISSLWRNSSPERLKGSRRYIRRIRKIIQRRVKTKASHSIRKVVHPALHRKR